MSVIRKLDTAVIYNVKTLLELIRVVAQLAFKFMSQRMTRDVLILTIVSMRTLVRLMLCAIILTEVTAAAAIEVSVVIPARISMSVLQTSSIAIQTPSVQIQSGASNVLANRAILDLVKCV